MAELKEIQDLEVGIPLVDSPSTQTEPPIILPQRKTKRISLLEKITFMMLIVVFVGLAVATVSLSTAVTKNTEEITQIQQETNKLNEEVTRLEQEKSELSKVDRVKAIADEAGLETIEGNIRTVNK